MKILIVSQRFWPENFRINDIASELKKRGNQVTVLTGLPNYPEGSIYPEYKHFKNRRETKDGISIIRSREIARHKGLAFRFLNYYSFPIFASEVARNLSGDFDVVLVNELSPIMGCLPAIAYKKKFGVKIIMYEMDLWPQSLLAGGIKEDSFIYRHYINVSSKIYSSFDKILVSTREHENAIKELPGCAALDISFLPQYAEDQFSKIDHNASPNGIIHILFAGNIGAAQSVSTIIDAANLLKERSEYVFDIVGSGSQLKEIMSNAKKYNLKNVLFYGKRPISEMPAFYSKADIALVTLRNHSYSRMTIPGKVQSYMAAGIPIICAADGATASLVRDSKSGLCVPSDNAKELANAIVSFTKEKRELAGIHSRKYFNDNFRKEIFMDKLMKTLDQFKK